LEENPKGKYLVKFGGLFGVIGYLSLLIFIYSKKIKDILP
jgi:hypothetical protein